MARRQSLKAVYDGTMVNLIRARPGWRKTPLIYLAYDRFQADSEEYVPRPHRDNQPATSSF